MLIVFSTALITIVLIHKAGVEASLSRSVTEDYRVIVTDRLLGKTRGYEKRLQRIKDPVSAALIWMCLLTLFALITAVFYYGV